MWEYILLHFEKQNTLTNSQFHFILSSVIRWSIEKWSLLFFSQLSVLEMEIFCTFFLVLVNAGKILILHAKLYGSFDYVP